MLLCYVSDLFQTGVQAGNSLDNLGRTRFHCFEPAYHLMGTYPDWFYKYDANGAKWVCLNIPLYPFSLSLSFYKYDANGAKWVCLNLPMYPFLLSLSLSLSLLQMFDNHIGSSDLQYTCYFQLYHFEVDQ